MPILDKLTTVVEWDIDTSKLERYETLVNQSEISTTELTGATKTADASISAINTGSIEALSADIEIAIDGMSDLGEFVVESSQNLNSMGASASAAGASVGSLAAETSKGSSSVAALGSSAGGAGAAVSDLSAKEQIATEKTKGLKTETDKASTSFSSIVKSLVGYGAAVAGIFTGMGFMASKHVAMNAKLAESVGMNVKTYMAWGRAADEVGMSQEGIIDLMTKTSARMGEMQETGQMKPLVDSLKMLNIEFKDIQDLAPEEQFRKIMGAAKDTEDDAVARAAVFKLFRGEATKLVGHLRNTDGSLDSILAKYEAFNLLTAEGAEGSKKLSEAFEDLSSLMLTGLAEATGRMGEHLSDITDKISGWVLVNRELIDQKIDSVARVMADAFRWVSWGVEKMIGLVEALGGAGNVIKQVAIAFSAWKLQRWIAGLSAFSLKMTDAAEKTAFMKKAIGGLKAVGSAGLFSIAALALEDLYYFLTGGNSAIGRFMDENLPKAESAALHFFGVLDDGMTESQKQDITAAFRQGFVDGIGQVETFFGTATSTAAKAFGDIGGTFASMGSSIADTLYGIFDTVTSSISGTIYSLSGTISEFFSGIFQTISDKISGVIENLKNGMRSLPLIGSLVDAPAMQSAGIPAFASGNGTSFAPQGMGSTGRVSPVTSVPAWARASANNSTSSVVNNINIPVSTNANPQEIATAVSREMRKNFSDTRTSGIKR